MRKREPITPISWVKLWQRDFSNLVLLDAETQHNLLSTLHNHIFYGVEPDPDYSFSDNSIVNSFATALYVSMDTSMSYDVENYDYTCEKNTANSIAGKARAKYKREHPESTKADADAVYIETRAKTLRKAETLQSSSAPSTGRTTPEATKEFCNSIGVNYCDVEANRIMIAAYGGNGKPWTQQQTNDFILAQHQHGLI